MVDFIQTVLQQLTHNVQYVPNAFKCYNPDTQCWDLNTPAIKDNNIIVFHFQDNVHPHCGCILELDYLERFYADCLDRICVVHWSHGLKDVYRGPIKLIEYSWHNVHTCTSVANRISEWQPYFTGVKTQAWQSLNGKWTQHRQRVYEVLKSWPNGVLSFADQLKLPTWDYNTTYRGGTDNDENFVRLAPLYASCLTNVVTETQYVERPGIVTEKTLLAMIAEQIPIVIGHPGIVQDCRDLGFDMFDDLVNNTYDHLPNDTRAESALHKNKNLILGNVKIDQHIQDRLKKQKEFVLYQFPEIMKQNLTNQLLDLFRPAVESI